MEEDVEITQDNFTEYFRDVRYNRPSEGDIMARFWAVVEFADGNEKLEVIDLLKQGHVYQAIQIMRKIHGASAPGCYHVCRQMCEDLLMMEEEDVNLKRYEFLMEFFYYTKKQYVPDNKHWEIIRLLEYDEKTKSYKSTLEL